ncbi:hypothetical protein D3C79_768670 [compost metagenome]
MQRQLRGSRFVTQPMRPGVSHGIILAHRRLCITEGHILVGHIADRRHNSLCLHGNGTQRLGRVVRDLLFLTKPHTVIDHYQRFLRQCHVWHEQFDAVLPQAGLNNGLRRPGL